MFRTRMLSLAGLTAVLALSGTLVAGVWGLQGAEEPVNPFSRPEVVVHTAPPTLELNQRGAVTMKAGPPAAPGDTVYLQTAGTYNAGWVRLSEAVLDENLSATLTIPGRDYLGSYEYWVAIPASGRHLEGSSGRFTVQVVSPPPQQDPDCGGTRFKGDGTPWVCTFSDDFDGVELDRRYWAPQKTEISGFTTGTRVRYACALDDQQTIDVRDGDLLLSLVDLGEARDCGKNRRSRYAFGQVMHHQTYAQTYGKYEVRARIPVLNAPGAQQSFWLWPESMTYGAWPASGELDFAEMYSNDPEVSRPYMHYLPGQPVEGNPNSNNTHERCPIVPGEYNTYGMTWQPGRVTIRVNGEVCMINDYNSLVAGTGSPAPFDHPFYLALNQAMGTLGNEYVPGTLPERVTTEVDYVRIWR